MTPRAPTPETTPPAAQGYRHPAEWEPHEATWLAWPHNHTDWPGKMGAVPWAYAEMARHLAPGERVRIWVRDAAQERRARGLLDAAGVPRPAVEFFRHATNRSWTRDMGPIFVRRDAPRPATAIVRFEFNAWARYRNWQRDRRCPELAAKRLGLPLFPVTHRGRPVVLEGGAIDVNGRGTLLTTEECLLDQAHRVRNPGFTREDMETIFAGQLGATNVLWLGRGIAGDDTHGHVDDLCRFVNPTTVVLAQERDTSDDNYAPLQENRERLQDLRLENGARPTVVPLPMPRPLTFKGQRLPASYANFYIANAAVLVPTFNDPNDRQALGILAELFTDRPVIGIHAVDLVLGLGSLHCLTHEQPRA